MDESDEYACEVINNEHDARLCAQLIAEEFVAHEPVCIHDQVTSEFFFNEFLWPLISEVLGEGLSFLARHRSSGEIIAAIFANDLYQAHKKHPYDPSSPPAAFAFLDLLDEMDDTFIHQDFGQELKPGMVLHIMTGATRAQRTGQGVASQLRTFMCNYVRDVKGFQYALVQVTSPATRHIYTKKLGGKEVTVIDLKTWVWKKKGDGLTRPYKDYQGGIVPNILVELKQIEKK